LVELKEIKYQLKGQAICTECLLLDDCIDKYPEVGCPALRFLKRIAENLKVKSVSELAFKALDFLTEGEDELWVAHIVFDGQARCTGGIQKIMKNDCGNSYDSVQRILKRLVEKGIVYRVIQGIYAPNLKLVLHKMLELLEGEK